MWSQLLASVFPKACGIFTPHHSPLVHSDQTSTPQTPKSNGGRGTIDCNGSRRVINVTIILIKLYLSYFEAAIDHIPVHVNRLGYRSRSIVVWLFQVNVWTLACRITGSTYTGLRVLKHMIVLWTILVWTASAPLLSDFHSESTMDLCWICISLYGMYM
jgi:hypothetical protein